MGVAKVADPTEVPPREAEPAVGDGDGATARKALERVAALQREDGLEPAPEDNYPRFRSWMR